jgi:FtsP/CotA-like multicopper oxidase with cupredoxin domain
MITASESAQPDMGRAVVVVDLEAREVEWEFAPGQRTRAWAYNGQVPGPTIDAQVGDVVEVRFTNHLPEPTVVHWHGLRLPAVMDGTEHSQRPVDPGEHFTYRFRVPDAGTFWYHSHCNETVQVERGLYGALVVRAADEPQFDADRTFVLSDIAFAQPRRAAVPGRWIQSHDGREGDTRLINGRREPEIPMAAGQVERWRIVNAAAARYVRLSIGGRPFQVIGSGGGLLPAPVTVTDVLLCTADRKEIVVGPFAEGETIRIETLPFDRGSFKSHRTAERFGTVIVGAAARSVARMPARLREIAPLVTGTVTPTRTVRLGFSLGATHGAEFNINREQHHHADAVRVGELQIWDITNRSPIHHPFHLHGFFFQVLDINGVTTEQLSWEDTVDVPPFGRVRIAWRPDDRPGEWMYHCHILEHHAAGMMAHFHVVR